MVGFKEDIRDINRTGKKLFAKHKITIMFLFAIFLICYLLPQNKYFDAFNSYKNEAQSKIASNIFNIRQYLSYHSKHAHEQYNNEQEQLLVLTQQINLLKSRLLDYEMIYENLNYIPFDYRFSTAKVIKLGSSEYNKNMYISNRGVISTGDIVLDNEGVVGIIDYIGSNYARVLLYNDPKFKISAIGKESGNRYILSGNAEDNILIIQYIDNKTYTIIDEDLLTSGEDGKYYPGIFLGRLKRERDKYVIRRNTDFIDRPFVFVLESVN